MGDENKKKASLLSKKGKGPFFGLGKNYKSGGILYESR